MYSLLQLQTEENILWQLCRNIFRSFD